MVERARLAGVKRDEKQTARGMGDRQVDRGKEGRTKDSQCTRRTEVTNVTKEERYEKREQK